MTDDDEDEDHPILLFDGVCNLCNRLTQFVIKRDPSPAMFRFASLQSDAGQRILREYALPTDSLDTFVMIDRGRAYVCSTAALRTLKHLGFPWSLLYPFIIVPRPLRDAMYRFIAKHRYSWFGKRETCMIPSPDIEWRFIS